MQKKTFLKDAKDVLNRYRLYNLRLHLKYYIKYLPIYRKYSKSLGSRLYLE